tara:strand:+ start:58 stop:201 length:144 start_codon:yes stop_codon:yes gene_type:complete
MDKLNNKQNKKGVNMENECSGNKMISDAWKKECECDEILLPDLEITY